MTAQEKAAHLLLKYMSKVVSKQTAKECALVCCDEVLRYMGADGGYEFWTSVKKEIEKL
jgi:hypothetical protein